MKISRAGQQGGKRVSGKMAKASGRNKEEENLDRWNKSINKDSCIFQLII